MMSLTPRSEALPLHKLYACVSSNSLSDGISDIGGGPGAKKGAGGLMKVEAVPAQGEKGCYLINGEKYKAERRR